MANLQQVGNFRNVSIYKSFPLGSGSFGSVYKAKCDQLPCAAKILHTVFFSREYSGYSRIAERFKTECQLLSLIRHPNIVQYLSTAVDTESGQPVLLMELCDESLTKFLEQSLVPLPYHTELSISHDITLALVYLHSNGILHRDLSSNNVLMDGGRAKVSDFGMSKLQHIHPQLTPVTDTLCPGTAVFMPPEALDDPPSYTEKLDVFSFGVLLVQIMTRKFPDPGPRFRVINDPRYSMDVSLRVPIREVERRRAHFQLIDDSHPLKSLALQCLDDKERGRPTAQDLSISLEQLKAAQSSPRQSPRADTCMRSWSQPLETHGYGQAEGYQWLQEEVEHVTTQLTGCNVTSYSAHQEHEEPDEVEREKSGKELEKEKKLRVKEKMWKQEKERRKKDLERLKPVVDQVQRSLEQKVGKLRSLLEEVLNDSTESDDAQSPVDLSDSSEEPHEDADTDGAVANKAADNSLENVELQCIPTSALTYGDLLAQGGQAAVWKGVWEGQVVAIKKYTNQPDPRDICILQRLPHHPNIITVHGVVRDKFSCSIVMELTNGGSLYNFIHEKKNIPSPQQRSSWMKDIATGMEFLHSKGIAHRDLKSANVLLAEDTRKTAMLCDFGTAKLIPHTTVHNTCTGTFRWMAPEIFKGAPQINMKCDVFSYSMILCEIITLNLPFKDSQTDQMAMIDVMTGKRPTLSQADPNCPPFLYHLITACWSEDPRDRPSFPKINLALSRKTFN